MGGGRNPRRERNLVFQFPNLQINKKKIHNVHFWYSFYHTKVKFKFSHTLMKHFHVRTQKYIQEYSLEVSLYGV